MELKKKNFRGWGEGGSRKEGLELCFSQKGARLVCIKKHSFSTRHLIIDVMKSGMLLTIPNPMSLFPPEQLVKWCMYCCIYIALRGIVLGYVAEIGNFKLSSPL